jgi:N utilization substance protein B
MATPRDIRRLAFQILYQIDARGADDPHALADAAQEPGDMTRKDRDKAVRLALEAYNDRSRADAAMTALAPTWPAHRQAAVDRAILRLAHYEMTVAGTPPRVVVNEAVELAKAFSTEKSPTFINGLLDRIMKSMTVGSGAGVPESEGSDDPGGAAPPT